MARVVVIGAGMGGLAAAARLASSGHQVTVFEQGPTYGGKLGVVRKDGFTFDTGPSLLTLPQVYRDLFADTGGPLDDVVELTPVHPTCHYRFPDGSELDMPHAEHEVEAAVAKVFGRRSAAEWRSILTGAERLWNLVGESVLQSPLGGVRDLVRRSASVRDLMAIAPWRTLRATGRRHLTDPRLRMLLDRYATYSGSDPRRTPGLMTVIPFIEQRFGGWYVRGGLRRLADALAERCTDLGVRLHFDVPVRSVETTSSGVSGLQLADGRHVGADIVVSNADARHLYQEMVPDRRADHARRALRRVQPSLSGFVLLLALRGRSREPRRHHRVLFPADYDTEFDAIFGSRPHPVADPTIYVSAPDDPLIRPADAEAWFVLVNAPPQGTVDWRRPGFADDYAGKVLQIMAERGLEVRHRLLWREIRSPADLAEQTGAIGGCIYGSSSNGPRAALLRPANRSPIPGLFLVGGSAHPGGGLPLVAMSAAIVARLIGPA